MIICPSCGTENQDHFRFCQGCGTDVSQAPRGLVVHEHATTEASLEAVPEVIGTPAVPPFVEPVEHEERQAGVPEVAVPAPAVADCPAAAATHPCATCGHSNEVGTVVCGACGLKLAPAVVAPAPAASAPPDARLGRTSLGGVSPLVAAAPPKAPRFSFTLLRVDGTDAGLFTSHEDRAVLGRDTGGIFATDATLSPLHARVERRGDRLFVTDANSLNGVFRRLVRNAAVALENGDGFRIGQEVLRFEVLPEGDLASDVHTLGSPRRGVRARVVSIVGRGEYGDAAAVPPTGLLMGRERGDVLFPEDGYVSGLHCKIHFEGLQPFLTDLGSSNGTFLRVRGDHEVAANDVLLLGQQLFRVGIP